MSLQSLVGPGGCLYKDNRWCGNQVDIFQLKVWTSSPSLAAKLLYKK